MYRSEVTLAFLLLAAATSTSHASDPAIERIQSEIAALDGPKGYYSTTYRPSETRFWSHLPEWMREDATGRHAAAVLDIGCGYGTLLAFAAEIYQATPYCMDVTHYIPQFGEQRGFHFTKGNIQLDPVPSPAVFDVILMTEVLEHFNFAPLPTLKKIRAALAPGGVFFLTTPDAAEWGRQTKYYSHLSDLPAADPAKPFVDDHIWVYDRKELLRLVAEAGFRVVKSGYSPGVGHRHFNLELRPLP